MELRVLKYFLTVAREENITRAAEILHVTQPTLSRQLMQIEEELGVKLFKRGKHNIILTNEGMLLKERASEVIALTDKITQDFSNKDDTLSGTITIGSGETYSMNIVSQMIVEFQKKNPNVHFEIYSAIADDIKDRIEKGIVDIGLLTEPVDIGKYDFIRMPHKDKWRALIRKDNPLAEKEYVTPEDLSKVPLLMAKRESIKNEIANWFGDYYGRVKVAATYNLLYNTAIMVNNGIGVALCFEHENGYKNLCLKPLSPPMETGTVLVWKKHRTNSSAVSAFIKFCKKYIQGITHNTI